MIEIHYSKLFGALKLNQNDLGTFHYILRKPTSDDARKVFDFMALIHRCVMCVKVRWE